ncbi:MAG: tail fiber domain-containing protein [Parcubacteria group bacterium]|nr:tail fiber domain-containing protein [Parcubacteria group bacterium]
MGIGTTSPSATFSVNGAGVSTGRTLAIADANNKEILTIFDNGKIAIDSPTETYGILHAATTSALTYTASDGVNLPPALIIENKSTGENTTADLIFYHGTAATKSSRISSIRESGGTELAFINHQAGGRTEVMRLDSSGNLGIGTTSPSATFSVNGIAGYGFFFADTGGASRTAGGVFSAKEVEWTSTASTRDSALVFATMLDGAMAEKVRITSTGVLGIGVVPNGQWTNTPALDIGDRTGLAGVSDETFLGQNALYNGTAWLYKETAAASQVYLDGAASYIFRTAGSGSAGNTITFTEKMKIDVNGNMFATGLETGTTIEDDVCWSSATGEIRVNTSNDCNSSSSLRYKENVADLDYGLAEVMQLRPVFFNYLSS